MTTTITTNGHQRDLVTWFHVPTEHRSDFNYILPDGFVPSKYVTDWPDECYRDRFFKYRDSWYDVNEFEVIQLRSSKTHNSFALTVDIDSPLVMWNAAQTDSAFSGIVLRWGTDWDGTPSLESVVVGSAYWG